METIERDFAPRGVRFYYVYKALAHPEHDGYVKAFTLQERLMHVREAERRLGSNIPWLADGMSNDLKNALGGAQNAELVIDPEGRVVRRRAWSDPSELRRDLEQLIGPVEKPTRLADLNLMTEPPGHTIASGILPRIEVKGPMRALKIEPLIGTGEIPFYAKLRAEADEPLLATGNGKLYLGFHLDPLYHVHWNNRTRPLEFELVVPEGVSVSPKTGGAPVIEEPADIDPREFLVDVTGGLDLDAPLELSVRYFACDDANTFCVPVTQRYLVHLRPDPEGGRVMARGGRGGFGGSDRAARLMSFDANGDGRVTRAELPEQLRQRFNRMDSNSDGAIDADEARALARRGRPGHPRSLSGQVGGTDTREESHE